MSDALSFTRAPGSFADRFSAVPVFGVTAGTGGFAAFVYQCRLNLDIDGAPNTYGLDNAANKSQADLKPLESWHKGRKGVSTATSQKVGLGNAAGDPGDGTKGWQNFLNGNRKFYWAGLKAMTKLQAKQTGTAIDDRAMLEAGLGESVGKGKPINLASVGMGWFPVLQASGYFMSTTSVQTTPGNYLDSTVVPYAVWANAWKLCSLRGHKVALGDVGLAIRNSSGAATPFVYGDSGTPNKVGESSQKLHDALGGGDDPGMVTFIAFPGSGSGNKLGANPEKTIPFQVLAHTISLGNNARDLAQHLAMGQQSITIPKQAEMTTDQAARFDGIYKALTRWTVVTV
ncbi:MAG TPA: hypothetical protein VGL53_30135 [Bryobacteraceae bacterium]|jgi:hypothetical protein